MASSQESGLYTLRERERVRVRRGRREGDHMEKMLVMRCFSMPSIMSSCCSSAMSLKRA